MANVGLNPFETFGAKTTNGYDPNKAASIVGNDKSHTVNTANEKLDRVKKNLKPVPVDPALVKDATENAAKTSCLEGCNKWKVAAIVAGVLLIISIIAVVALSLPFTAPAIAAIGIAGTALAATKVGALVATGVFCLLTVAFAAMAKRQTAQQHTTV